MNTIELQRVAKFLKNIADQAMAPNLEKLHLTKAEMLILSVLIDEDGLSISDIKHIALLPQSQVSTAVASLVEREWAVLVADPRDGRKTTVRLTPEIRAGGKKAFTRDARSLVQDALPELSPADISKLNELVTTIFGVINTRGKE